MQYQILVIIYCITDPSQGAVNASGSGDSVPGTLQDPKGAQSQPRNRNNINKSSCTNPAMQNRKSLIEMDKAAEEIL